MAQPAYPFEPRSTAQLREGQFWAIPLANSRFGCGRVLAVPRDPDPAFHVSRVAFLAGLMDWVGDAVPTSGSIAGARLRGQGFAHVLTIRATGGEVLGQRDLDIDGIVPALWRVTAADPNAWVYQGAVRLRRATPADEAMPVITHWGFKFIERLAEQAFVGPVGRDGP